MNGTGVVKTEENKRDGRKLGVKKEMRNVWRWREKYGWVGAV